MMSVKCNRCNMTFAVMPESGGEATSCTTPNCTRRFHHKDNGETVTVYMTPKDIGMTLMVASERKRNGLPVDNGGIQEGDTI